MSRWRQIAVISCLLISPLRAAPPERQIAHDAADFHRFRIDVLAQGTDISRAHPGSSAGAEYIAAACRKLAARTTPDYLYGVIRDLSQDTSRTEEPYLIAENLAVAYPPDAATRTLNAMLKLPGINASEIQAWIEDIDRIRKGQSP